MIASFTPLKDGPGGASLPGSSAAVESPAQKLQRYVSTIKSQREQDLQEPVCDRALRFNDKGDPDTFYTKCCCLFANPTLREEIVNLVTTMRPAPPIPEEALRYFVEGNVFLKAAKNAADYKLAINTYKKALIEAPWWGDAYNNLGIALNAAERREDAKQALQLYLLTKPADASKAQTKIYELGAQEQLNEERERQEEARQNQCALEFKSGLNAAGRGAPGFEQAIQQYKKASELCSKPPDLAMVYINLGEVYRLQGKLDDAYKYMQKSFEVEPDPRNANALWRYTNFGKLLDDRGDHPAACRYWRKGCDAGSRVCCGNLSRCP
jgi:tetratricopeptide (TPR) repeat protein